MRYKHHKSISAARFFIYKQKYLTNTLTPSPYFALSYMRACYCCNLHDTFFKCCTFSTLFRHLFKYCYNDI